MDSDMYTGVFTLHTAAYSFYYYTLTFIITIFSIIILGKGCYPGKYINTKK